MSHNNQKKIAVINDLSGFGRCSIAVALPLISHLGIQCCPLPTAIFSNHTGFPSFYFDDYTDSMEPYIPDGSIQLAKRGAIIHDGDVGLFFVDGDMKCKQYCQDYYGNVHLFSLNRNRSDADMDIPASSGIMLMCFGKVLLPENVPLPQA